MDLGIEGRVALVTGGSKGIGLGIATALAAEGVRVAVASRTQETVDAAARELGGQGFVYDSGDLDAIPGLLDGVESALGPIDIYVANTGGPPPGADPLAFTREQWEAAHRTLVLSPMAFLERLLPGMRERGFGRIVVISSGAARSGLPGQVAYAASKAGLLGMVRTIAAENAGRGITANAVLPGMVATDKVRAMPAEVLDAVIASLPAGRMASPEEVAALVAFLASEDAGYITGEAIGIDGGFGLNTFSLGRQGRAADN
jgi:3-oxoacyl-[acyl-carrier protein] reductase